MIRELAELERSDWYPFHMPGHKRQAVEKENWVDTVYRHDITEIDGFDDLRAPEGMIGDIEIRLAGMYRSKQAYLSVNGSTCCNLSAISALVPVNGRLMMDKEAHVSVYNAADLNRLDSVLLNRKILADSDLTACISPDEIKKKLLICRREDRMPDAVLITSPTYEGFTADVDHIADIVHEYGIPLIVDGAHGAHFDVDNRKHFFPELSLKADVTIVSLHKTLPALTQVSALLVNGDNVKPYTIKQYINMFQTTSPSYILMSSAERCLQIMERDGAELKSKLHEELDLLYSLNKSLNRLRFTGPEYIGKYGIHAFDPSKINIMDVKGGMTGRELYDIFRKEYHLQPERAGKRTCLMLTSVMDSKEGFRKLMEAVKEIDKR